jgi:Tfp pilus assembly PilM family ATPase
VPGLADALAERLGVETRIANPIERLGVKAGAVDLEEARSTAPLMMLSVGLALRRLA